MHNPLTIISSLAHRDVCEDGHLDQIGLDGIQLRYCMPCLLEERMDLPMFSDDEIHGWQTVGDVVKACVDISV